MPLNSQTFSDNFANLYLESLSIDESGNFVGTYQPDGNIDGASVPSFELPVSEGGSFDFGSAFASAYEVYAEEGLVTNITPPTVGDSSLIASVLNTPRTAEAAATTVSELANAFAVFWSTSHITTHAPPTNTPVSVVNDAMAFVPAFEAAILASYTTESTQPFFTNLIDNLYNLALVDVTWTLNELIPGSPPTPVTITANIT